MTRPPSPAMRRTVAGLTLSAAALVGIVLHEGYTDRAVIPVKGDVPTIGSMRTRPWWWMMQPCWPRA